MSKLLAKKKKEVTLEETSLDNKNKLPGDSKARSSTIKISSVESGKRGNLDEISETCVAGWYISETVARPARLRLYADGVLVSEVVAGEIRNDVKNSGYQTEKCGFRIPLPDWVKSCKFLEMVDCDDETAVWAINFNARTAVNDLMHGELPCATSGRRESEKEQIGLDLRIIFDVSDLVYYLGHHDNLTGIQRVQSCVIQAMVSDSVMRLPSIDFISYDSSNRKFNVIDKNSFLSLLADLSHPTLDRKVKFDKNKAREGVLFSLGELQIESESGRNTVISLLGAAWVIPDYVQIILDLKRRFGIRFVPTFHDLIPIYAKETCDQGTAEVFKVFLDQIIRHVDVALCVSKNTANDLKRYCAENGLAAPKTHVTRNGSSIDDFFKINESIPDTRTIEHLLDQPYVLFVSTVEGRKNHLYAFQIWERLVREGVNMPRIVCVGRLGWRSEGFLQALLRTDNLNGLFEVVEDISDAELKTLYERCEFTIYPSLYEGWGLPVGESLSYGKPCVLSRSSSLPEVAGDLGVYISLDDINEASNVIRSLVESPSRLSEISANIRKDFVPITWAEVASEVVKGCREAIAKQSQNLLPYWQLGKEYTFRQLRVDTNGKMGQEMLDIILKANEQVLLSGFVAPDHKILGLESRGGRWHSPETWGCWSDGHFSTVRFLLEESKLTTTSELAIYVALQVPGEFSPCSVSLRICGAKVGTTQAIKGANSIHCWHAPVHLVINRAKKHDSCGLEVVLELELKDVSQTAKDSLRKIDRRNLGIGLKSVLVTEETDYSTRCEVIEKLVF